MMLYHRLFRSTSCMPTSRSYPIWSNFEKKSIYLPSLSLFSYHVFFITSSFFSFESFLKSLPGQCLVIAQSLPSHRLGHCISHSNDLVSLSYPNADLQYEFIWTFCFKVLSKRANSNKEC